MARLALRPSALPRYTSKSSSWVGLLRSSSIVIPPSTDRIVPRSLPSLIGRDVLRPFRLELSYGDAPQVLLETL